MNPMPQLETLLKLLRLSGILDSLEARNRQAIESQLAYTDFLSLLVQDEVARRDQRQFAQRLRTKSRRLQPKFVDNLKILFMINRMRYAIFASGTTFAFLADQESSF
jgi:hypothetical protein